MEFKEILNELNDYQNLLSLPMDSDTLCSYFASCVLNNDGLIRSAINNKLEDMDTLYLYKIGEYNIGDIFNIKDSPRYVEDLGEGKWISILYFSKENNKMYIVPCRSIYIETFIEQIGLINPNFLLNCKDYNSMPKSFREYLLNQISDPIAKFKEIINFKINYSNICIKMNSPLYKYILNNINCNPRIIQYLFNNPHLLSKFSNFFTDETWKCMLRGRDYLK